MIDFLVMFGVLLLWAEYGGSTILGQIGPKLKCFCVMDNNIGKMIQL